MSSCTEGPQKTWLFPSGDVCYIGLLRQYQNSTQVATRANAETRLIASLPPRPTPIATRSARLAALGFALARPSLMD